MALYRVPDEHGQQLWVDRFDPRICIVLDYWDSDRCRYRFHDRDRPGNCGDISAGVLDACYVRLDGINDGGLSEQPAWATP